MKYPNLHEEIKYYGIEWLALDSGIKKTRIGKVLQDDREFTHEEKGRLCARLSCSEDYLFSSSLRVLNFRDPDDRKLILDISDKLRVIEDRAKENYTSANNCVKYGRYKDGIKLYMLSTKLEDIPFALYRNVRNSLEAVLKAIHEEEKTVGIKNLTMDFYREVYDWSVSEIKEFGEEWIHTLEECQFPEAVIGMCKKLVTIICDIREEKERGKV